MHIFISYAKADTNALAIQLRDQLSQLPDVTVWMDETLEPGESWAFQIQQEIDIADYVVVLLSPDVNRLISSKQHRSFVLNEIDYAQQVGKLIIPIMAQATRVPVQIAGIEYLDFTTDQNRAMTRLIHKLGSYAVNHVADTPPPASVTSPLPAAGQPAESMSSIPSKTESANRPVYRRSGVIVSILTLIIVLLVIAFLPSFVPKNVPASQTHVQDSSAASTATEGNIATLDRSGTQAAQTEQDTTLSSTNWVETQNANQQAATQQAYVAATDVIATRIALSLNGVEHNTDWKPFYKTFNGIEMALVPVGCFTMGSEDGDDAEKPINKQCFDKPFWIDRYEVTNSQFGSSGEFQGNLNPRDSLSWYDAYHFCAQQGGYIPTEREWEYAARGPDDLIYPWGNEFKPENVVYNTGGSSFVGSKPAGNSWIGASDMSGNVREWVSSVYEPYSDNADNGRLPFNVSHDKFISVRGGEFGDDNPYNLRAAFRHSADPDNVNHWHIGVRCAHDY